MIRAAIVIDRAHDRARGIGGQHLQLLDDGGEVVGAVLAVDQQPVEAGGGHDFGGIAIGHAEEEPDLGLMGDQCALEWLSGMSMVRPQTKRQEIDAHRAVIAVKTCRPGAP